MLLKNIVMVDNNHTSFIRNYTGSKDEVARLEQLFIEQKFHPLDEPLRPLAELLTIPLNKEKKKRKRKLIKQGYL